ncbi:MAG TPA: DnaJ domain-containing protein [Candidatus Limnocylindrales bacterium]
MQQVSDPYRALGVARGATEAEIKAAHRKLAKRYHPDAGSKSETERFLRVQEAYRVLSDPLLRKEWDQKHAPGPVRATPDAPAARGTRRAAPKPKTAPEATERPTRPPDQQQSHAQDPRSRPRSARAYTWSAAEVPWWEEGTNRADKRPPSRRRPREAERADNPQETPPEEPVFSQQPDFEVYNRSSGAAWSSAARAYFRKGDADLPRRGTFHLQGTQVVTAGRARSVAQAEARRRAAAATAATAAATAAAAAPPAEAAPPRPVAHVEQPVRPAAPRAAPRPQTGRDANVHIVPSRPAPWPTIGQRLLYSLIGWIPLAALIALATTDAFGDMAASGLAAVVLGILVVVPRVAYVAAIAGVCVLFIGGLFVGALAISGSGLSTAAGLATAVSGFIVIGYAATAAILLIGPASLRPWSVR